MTVDLRELRHADLGWLLTLNNANLPHVGALDAARLRDIVAEASHALVAVQDGRPAGALLALPPAARYDSPNFLWFRQRFARFVYVDRIMVAATARTAGVGRALYARLFRLVDAAAGPVACEVNERPPNPGSLAFHRRLGFREVGRLEHAPDKRVVMLAREPTSA